jgi:hypothetical protein
MKSKINKWYIVAGLTALILVALAQIAAGDWWAIHYAKYLAGVDNAYLGEAGQVCFGPTSHAASPDRNSVSRLAGPVARP